jgi:hypothetical protein
VQRYTGGWQIGHGLHSLPGGVSDWLHVRPELDLWVALTPGGVSDWLHARPELDLWVALTPGGGCQIGYAGPAPAVIHQF